MVAGFAGRVTVLAGFLAIEKPSTRAARVISTRQTTVEIAGGALRCAIITDTSSDIEPAFRTARTIGEGAVETADLVAGQAGNVAN